jgi:nitrogen fixation protein FixH
MTGGARIVRALGASLVVSFLLLTACAQPQSPVANAFRQQKVINDLTITLEMAEELRVNQQQSFVITLADQQGLPVTADVYLDLVMPAHPMGTNQPLATSAGGGVYRAASAFTMDGQWTVTVVATSQGTKNQAVFDVMVLP